MISSLFTFLRFFNFFGTVLYVNFAVSITVNNDNPAVFDYDGPIIRLERTPILIFGFTRSNIRPVRKAHYVEGCTK